MRLKFNAKTPRGKGAKEDAEAWRMIQSITTHQTATLCLPTVLAVFFAPWLLCVFALKTYFVARTARFSTGSITSAMRMKPRSVG